VKKKLVLAGVAVIFLVVVVVLVQLQPERLTAATMEKAKEVQKQLDTMKATEQEKTMTAQATGASPDKPAAPQPATPATPAPADANVVKVKFDTSKGAFVVEVHKDWAPKGAARFLELVQLGYFNDNRFFRVVTQPKPFVVQWGIAGDPKLAQEWWDKTIQDDPVKQSNAEGTLTFAAGGAPNSRSSQLFINLGNNRFLDGMGFAPIAKVVEGMDVVKSLNNEYQEQITNLQTDIVQKGNAWLDQKFPGLDYIKSATVVQ